jgi:hypothetical protein
MRPVSEEFQRLVTKSHRVATQATLYPADGTDPVTIPIIDGTVTLDSTASVRARCDIQVADPDWIPVVAGDKLSPFGSEIELRRGLYLSDGSVETVALGRFGIEDAEITDDGTGTTVRVTALDRAEQISKAKFEDAYQVDAGTDFTEAILNIVSTALPGVETTDGFDTASSLSIGVPVTALPGDDPWEFAQALATTLGMRLFFDGDGILNMAPFSSGQVAAEIVEGENGVLLTVSRNWSRTGSFNRVIVTGETGQDDTTYRGEATDTDPASPTFYGGPFGNVPEFRTYPQITSDSHAQDVAEAILAQEIGAPSNVSFGMIPNPALEPDDTVLISRPSIGVNEAHVLDSLTIGLGASETMSGTTRERRTI